MAEVLHTIKQFTALTFFKQIVGENTYPLAVLLRRVFFSGWPAQSFAAMRAQLHPKICASLFGSSI